MITPRSTPNGIEPGRWAHLAVALSDERTQLLTAKLVQV